MEIKEDELHYQYTLDVLKALHLNFKSFFDDLEQGKPYELKIYHWMNELYQQGKNSDEAIQHIHQQRWKILTTIDILPKR